MEVYCKKCGTLSSEYDFNCSECGEMLGASKCYLCNVELDNLNKFTCDKQKLADGRTVLVCSKCSMIYTEGIKIAKEKGFEIKKSVVL